jgi:hypothetical protein
MALLFFFGVQRPHNANRPPCHVAGFVVYDAVTVYSPPTYASSPVSRQKRTTPSGLARAGARGVPPRRRLERRAAEPALLPSRQMGRGRSRAPFPHCENCLFSRTPDRRWCQGNGTAATLSPHRLAVTGNASVSPRPVRCPMQREIPLSRHFPDGRSPSPSRSRDTALGGPEGKDFPPSGRGRGP